MKKYICIGILACSVFLSSCSARISDTETPAVSEETPQSTEPVTTVAPPSATPSISETVTDTGADAVGTEEEAEAVVRRTTAPTKEEVLAAREQALEGMSEDEITKLSETIHKANLWWEGQYLYEHIFDRLSNPDNLEWNVFHQTGEIQIGWGYDGDITDKEEICESEHLTDEEFYYKYGYKVISENNYDADAFISLISDLQDSVHNDFLKNELQSLMEETRLAKETHNVENASNIYKILHDLDYFLLTYGADRYTDAIMDMSLVSKYFGMLSFYG